MNKRRLLKMVELLNRIDHTIKSGFLDPINFDLRVWTYQTNECGTASCAVGFACRDSWFNAEGLELGDNKSPLFRAPKQEPLNGWFAVNAFFDLEETDSFYLFSADEYANGGSTPPATVAERINNFIKAHE